jgi:hypothetical protein
MEIINWIEKDLEEINKTVLYNDYFDNVPIEKGIDVFGLYNADKGIDIILHENNRIKAVHFFSGTQEGSTKFADKLPFDFNFDFSRNNVRLLLGVPDLSGGGDFSFIYGTTPPWDKYFFENFKMHLQYSSGEKSIELFTIES